MTLREGSQTQEHVMLGVCGAAPGETGKRQPAARSQERGRYHCGWTGWWAGPGTATQVLGCSSSSVPGAGCWARKRDMSVKTHQDSTYINLCYITLYALSYMYITFNRKLKNLFQVLRTYYLIEEMSLL